VHTPEQLFFNVATLPGWQKWMPMYRVGTITSISYEDDTASVDLDEARSSATGIGSSGSPTTNTDWGGPEGDPRGLRVNQGMPLDQIPVVYMECNADAFEVGDRVLVEFVDQDWDGARVIGFESNPKPCGWDYYLGYRLRAIPGSFACQNVVMTTCAAISSLPGGTVTLSNADWVVDLPAGRHYLYAMEGYIELPVCGSPDIRLQGKSWDYVDDLSRGTWQATVCDAVVMSGGKCAGASGSCSLEAGPSTRGPALPAQWIAPPKKITHNDAQWTYIGIGFSTGLGKPPTFLSPDPPSSSLIFAWYAR